jgi:hypothetical protein
VCLDGVLPRRSLLVKNICRKIFKIDINFPSE